MSTSMDAATSLPAASVPAARLGGIALMLGGIAFFAGGMTHPSDSGAGTKVEQLYHAYTHGSWYPSHTLLLASFALFAVAILLLRKRSDLGAGMRRLVNVVSVIAVVATVGMAAHLLSAFGAESIANGQPSPIYYIQVWNETILNTLWGLGIIALAVAGGVSGILGNRITIPLAVVGGAAWCLATATIAFTDQFDPLFPVSSLIAVWAVVAGLMWALRGGSATTSRA